MKNWKGKIVQWKNPVNDEEASLVGIVLTNPKEKSMNFSASAVALLLCVDVMWGDKVQHFIPIDELIICKSTNS